jgi:DNA mismatch repair protein MutL
MQQEHGSHITLLDDDTINQIAAGEVVERPASVVKELIENSLDAGASTISIDLASDTKGISRIKIIDDGCGIPVGDVEKAFLRHATSKVRRAEDLHSVLSMGFRGEALASISAIARVIMITRTPDTDMGTTISVSGGEVTNFGEVAAPAGTSVTIEDLFYNTPARRKFLRSRQTELLQVYLVVEAEALAHPHVGFLLSHNGQERIRTQSTERLSDTIGFLFGYDRTNTLIGISSGSPFMRIDGYISHPSDCRTNRADTFISVNHRPVLSKSIGRAVRAGYGTLVAKGSYPSVFLNLTIDTGLVDVNVHPTKREVRLSREREIMEEITRAVSETLHSIDILRKREPKVRSGDGDRSRLPPDETGVREDARKEYSGASSGGQRGGSVHLKFSTTDKQLRLTEAGDQGGSKGLLPSLKVIGQVCERYILAGSAADDELFLIDQHAAHERILYDQLCEGRNGRLQRQDLLVPLVVSLRPAEYAALKEASCVLEDQGFIVEEFGGDTMAVRSVPMVLGKRLGAEIIRDIAGDLIAEKSLSSDERKEQITCMVACRGAIKSGTTLSNEQMERLLDQLSRTSEPYTCPHGRPVIISYTIQQLDRLFHRS